MNNGRYFTTNQICEILKVSRTAVWRLANKGKLEKYKDPINGRVFFKIPDSIDFSDSNLLTIEEVCFIIGIKRDSLRQLKYKGLLIPCIDFDSHFIRYTKQQVDEYLKKRIEMLQKVVI